MNLYYVGKDIQDTQNYRIRGKSVFCRVLSLCCFFIPMPNFLDNVRYAVAGIRSFFSTEQNGRAQGVIALLVIVAGVFFGITAMEWALVLGCIALVICLEMVNSAIEKVCNLITTEYNPAIKTIKDMAAGAVLLAAFITAVVGLIIFLPYITRFLTAS